VITTGTQGGATGIRGGDGRSPSCPEAQLPASGSGRHLLKAVWNRERNEECGSAGASLRAALWELGGAPQLHRNDGLSVEVYERCDKGSREGHVTNLEAMGNLGNLILLAAILVRSN